MSNLQLRVISAIALAIPVLLLTWLGGFWFRVLAAVIGAAMLYEWLKMSRRLDGRSGLVPCAALGAGLVALLFGASSTVAFVLLGVGLVATVVDAATRGEGRTAAAGLAYAALSALSLAFLRGADAAGLWTILFLFATVWATDILAYFVGRAVGGPKLAPSISPGKTWSGAFGGLAGGVAGGIAVAAAAGVFRPVHIVIVVVLSIASQIGDLFESAIKRRYGVKDSSSLIPGHGGVMDRVDGLVAAAIVLYLVGAAVTASQYPARWLFPV